MKASFRVLYFQLIPNRITGIVLSVIFSGIALSLLLSALNIEPVNATVETTTNTFRTNTHEVMQVAWKSSDLKNDSNQMEWQENCVTRRMEVSGVGMGNGSTTITNPQTLTLAEPTQVDWLLAQVAGRYHRNSVTPGSVTFTTDLEQAITLSEPSYNSSQAYSFVTNMSPTGQITAAVNTTEQNDLTPRGLVIYARRTTEEEWTSVGLVKNEYVFSGDGSNAYTEVLTFSDLLTLTDIVVTIAVIDNDNDERPMILTATAGDVTSSVNITGPTQGELLNITNLVLSQVPTGTNQISVTLASPSHNGDSLVVVGLNVSFPCQIEPNLPSAYSIYLPLAKSPAYLFLPVSIYKPYLANDDCITDLINTIDRADKLPSLGPDIIYCSDLSDGTIDIYHIDLNITETVSVTLHNDGVATFVYSQLLIYQKLPESDSVKLYSACCGKPTLTITLPRPSENPLKPGKYYIVVQPAAAPSSTINYTLIWSILQPHD